MTNIIPINFSDLENYDLEDIQNQINQARLNKLQKNQERIDSKVEILQKDHELLDVKTTNGLDKVNHSVYKLTNEIHKTQNIAVNSVRLNQPKEDYVLQHELGDAFDISIGAKTVGKLLIASGLAKRSKEDKGRTVPYRFAVKDEYCKTANPKEGSTTYKWHYVKTIEHIDYFLRQNGYYEKFYSMEIEDDLEEFITHLYLKRINNEYN